MITYNLDLLVSVTWVPRTLSTRFVWKKKWKFLVTLVKEGFYAYEDNVPTSPEELVAQGLIVEGTSVYNKACVISRYAGGVSYQEDYPDDTSAEKQWRSLSDIIANRLEAGTIIKP